MKNMNETILGNTKEMRTKEYRHIAYLIGTFLILIGLMMLVIKGLSVEYIDAEGILHENFFLIPCGYFSILCGLIVFFAAGIRSILSGRRTERNA